MWRHGQYDAVGDTDDISLTWWRFQCRCIKQSSVWRKEARGPGGTARLVDDGKSPAKVELNPGLAPDPQTPLHSLTSCYLIWSIDRQYKSPYIKSTLNRRQETICSSFIVYQCARAIVKWCIWNDLDHFVTLLSFLHLEVCLSHSAWSIPKILVESFLPLSSLHYITSTYICKQKNRSRALSSNFGLELSSNGYLHVLFVAQKNVTRAV